MATPNRVNYYTYKRIPNQKISQSGMDALVRMCNERFEDLSTRVFGNVQYKDLSASTKKEISESATDVTSEDVKINATDGLRIDTVLSSGETTAAVYFQAKGTQIGLYRTSDNKQLWGGRLLPNGTVVTVTCVLYDPDGDEDSWVEFKQTVDGDEMKIVTPNYDGITPRVTGDTPTPDGTVECLTVRAKNMPHWNSSRSAYDNSVLGTVFSIGDLVLGAAGVAHLQGASGARINGKSTQYGRVAFSVSAGASQTIDVELQSSMIDAFVYLTVIGDAAWTTSGSRVTCFVVEGSVDGDAFQIRVDNQFTSSRSGYINWMAVDNIS